MRRIRHSIRRCNADRLEREAYARLLAAVFAEPKRGLGIFKSVPAEEIVFPEPTSVLWLMWEQDPQRWN